MNVNVGLYYLHFVLSFPSILRNPSYEVLKSSLLGSRR